jgi:hypothetical protein
LCHLLHPVRGIFPVPGYIIVSDLLFLSTVFNKCVLEVLLNIDARQDAFGIYTNPVAWVEPEICSQGDIVIVSVPVCLHLLVKVISCTLKITLECGIHLVIFILGIVAEPV